MSILYDVIAGLALVLTAYLLFLLLFEPGICYRVRGSLHDRDEESRLRLLADVLGVTPRPIETLQLFGDQSDIYRPQIDAIRCAQKSVHIEAYIFKAGHVADELLATLAARAREGVRVRLVIDAVGSLGAPARLFNELISAGGHVARYHALSWRTFRRLNSRTHRNMTIIDGRLAFVGGAGVADHWSSARGVPWRDCVVRLEGEIVRGLQGVFTENWLEASGELLLEQASFPDALPSAADATVVAHGLVVGSTPTAGLSTRARVLVQFMLASAVHSIELTSPYFIPDAGIRRELITARKRGVSVRILTGGRYGDHLLAWRAGRRRYGPLLRAGVDIWEYAPRMMHVKALVIDGAWCVLGSSNIDSRSFGLNDEVNLLVLSETLARTLQVDFRCDLLNSVQLEYRTWLRRSWRERLLETLGRVLERHQ